MLPELHSRVVIVKGPRRYKQGVLMGFRGGHAFIRLKSGRVVRVRKSSIREEGYATSKGYR